MKGKRTDIYEMGRENNMYQNRAMQHCKLSRIESDRRYKNIAVNPECI